MSEEQAVDSREDTVMTEVVTEDSGQLKDAEMVLFLNGCGIRL